MFDQIQKKILANWNILSIYLWAVSEAIEIISDLVQKKQSGRPIFICHICEIEKQFGY